MVIAHRASRLKLTDPLSRRGKARARRKLLGKNYKPKKLKPGDKRLLKGANRSAAQKAKIDYSYYTQKGVAERKM
jgi:hypothetical protein